MGGFYRNINILWDNQCEDFTYKVQQAISNALQNEYELIDTPEKADRSITIVPNNRFCSVFDDYFDYCDEDKLLVYLKKLSKNLKLPIVSIDVLDGDLVVMKLLANGQLTDEYCNMPWNFELNDKSDTSVQGNAKLWVDHLKLDIASDELEATWSNMDIMGEELVEKIWDLFGGGSDLHLSDCSLFPEDLKNGIQIHFRRKPNVPLTELEQRMQKLAEIDKLIAAKQKLFFQLFEEVFKAVFIDFGFKRTEKCKHYRVYERAYNGFSILLWVQFWELHFSINIYSRGKNSGNVNLDYRLFTLEDDDSVILSEINKAKELFLTKGVDFMQKVS